MALLYERPMHPYEMVTLMRERGKHESVRLRYSSLYSVVGALEREGLIVPRETTREGRRPERTVYEPPDEAVELLEERVRLLEEDVGETRARLEEAVQRLRLPRLFVIEHEHELMLKDAELRWVRDLVRQIKDGTLEGVSGWRSFYSEPAEERVDA